MVAWNFTRLGRKHAHSGSKTPQKSLPKPASSDGQELVVILRVRTVSTQGERKSVVIGGGDPVGVFFAWSVLHCRGQRCDAASSSLLVGW